MGHRISAPTARFSLIRVRQAFIGKQCGFTSSSKSLPVKATYIISGSIINMQEFRRVPLQKLK